MHLPPAPLQLIDYGIADGGTALDFWERTLTTIRDRNNRPITLVGNDLPENPHQDLALNLSRLQQHTNDLKVFIAPVSFYEQVVDDQTADLGFSATAMHWLSRVPGNLRSHIHANSAQDKEREVFRQQALDDFEQLMIQRAHELKPGGQLVLVNLAEADDQQSLGKNHHDRPMFDYMQAFFREALQEVGASEAILADTAFQNFYKRKADFAEVLARPSLRDTFRLVDHRIEHTPCPYRQRFDEDGDAAAFSVGLMKTIRSWSRHTFLTALRKHEADLTLADALYERMQAAFASDPATYSMDYIHSFLHLEKH